jgi:excisionase family DNA binding protein
MAKNLQEFLTPGEAAKLLGCGSQRIRDLDKAGELVAVGKTLGGWRLFSRRSVEEYLKKRGAKTSRAFGRVA